MAASFFVEVVKSVCVSDHSRDVSVASGIEIDFAVLLKNFGIRVRVIKSSDQDIERSKLSVLVGGGDDVLNGDLYVNDKYGIEQFGQCWTK